VAWRGLVCWDWEGEAGAHAAGHTLRGAAAADDAGALAPTTTGCTHIITHNTLLIIPRHTSHAPHVTPPSYILMVTKNNSNVMMAFKFMTSVRGSEKE
jgi:hypothetical protein